VVVVVDLDGAVNVSATFVDDLDHAMAGASATTVALTSKAPSKTT
jgi:hypothetical protein